MQCCGAKSLLSFLYICGTVNKRFNKVAMSFLFYLTFNEKESQFQRSRRILLSLEKGSVSNLRFNQVSFSQSLNKFENNDTKSGIGRYQKLRMQLNGVHKKQERQKLIQLYK